MANEETKPKGDVLFIKRIPPNLKDKFKLACMKRNKSMSEVIIKFMQKRTENE